MKFKEVLGFFKSVVGLSGVDAVVESPRLKGAVFTQAEKKRPLRQRSPLTVAEVRALEYYVVLSPPTNPEVVFAGYCLLCIHCVLRFGDGQLLQKEPEVDELFVEAGTTQHKTAHSRGLAKRLLPICGYSAGITGVPWAEA
eukprot:4442412-Amphidinium_carterae.1